MQFWQGAWLGLAVAASAFAYLAYALGLRRHLIAPNRSSWLIWSAASSVEAATYGAVNAGAAQRWALWVAAACCAALTVAVWRRSRWQPLARGDLACLALSLVALLVWAAFHQAFWAHMLVVAAVPVGFWPTWASAWADRAHERSPAWGWWTIGDLATLLVAAHAPATGTEARVGEFAYLVVELACHAGVWFMIGLATINPWRSLGRRRGAFWVVDGYRPNENLFHVGETHLGQAVFAAHGFAAGETVLRFSGASVGADALPRPLTGRRDRFMQVAADRWMGPSGAIDDLVNHSCDPNTGLRFAAEGVLLVATRDIAPGEEITWDYSTTLADPDWQMRCRCGAPGCRGTIGAFADLPPERQEWFRARNLVAPYLRRRDAVWHGRAA